MNTYTFRKEGISWYIDLPEFLLNGGTKGDLQMVDGADIMLEILAEGDTDITLVLDRLPFPGADELTLTEKCDPFIGGGYYYLKTFEKKEYNQRMWLCAVTEFVFGDLPESIFLKRQDQSSTPDIL